ncbi:hypothetical protein [Streptomyces phaeochromogenes]|uniref:hypothetical protein n=1 Tax=Streptomyces phaeochromogenes TaxID=1923 RepID=UPI002DDB9B8E|nr:hypothetical protein [Streptomyces phaeochromogenes]WRZ30197.1 hypothetical protein OG931_21825 [Streptomyces phaeochromogenes]
MSDTDPETEAVEEVDDEPQGMSERTAGLLLAGVLLLAMWGIVAAVPQTAYVVVGILLCLGWQKGRARLGRRDDDTEEEPEAAPPDVGEALRRLVGDDNGVLLTRLRDDLKLRDTKVVKALLDEAGITWKAVRAAGRNGPGVHVKDIPPAPSPAADTHGGGCCCRSGDNANSDNTPEGDGQKGTRVEPIGDGGRLVTEFVDRFFNAAASRQGTPADAPGEVNGT